MKALRSHDEMLAFELDTLRTQLGRSKKRSSQVGGLKKIVIDVPTSVDTNFSSALRTYLVEQTTASWHFWYGLLEEYKEEFGDCDVPLRYKNKNGFTLGPWVGQQRQKTLTPQKIKQLDDIGFVWNSLEEDFNKNIKALEAYKKEFGDCLVPKSYKTKDGLALANWVQFQRYKRKKEVLSLERIKQLDGLGFVWKLQSDWDQWYQALVFYKKEFGDCIVPRSYKTKDGLALANWVQSQRKSKETLTPERIKQLDDLGFVWKRLLDWNEWCQALILYKNEFGDCIVPRSYKTKDGITLGSWVGTQRIFKETLTPEKIKQLDDLGFVWDPLKEMWDKNIKALEAYKKEFGDCLVPKSYKTKDGLALGAWIGSKRMSKETLTPQKIKQLDDLGFVWDPLKEMWDKNIKALEAYKKEFGDCRVFQRYKTKDGITLGSWVGTQRRYREALSPEKIKQLDDLGFIWEVRDKNN